MENYEFYGYYGRPFVFVSGVSTHMMREEVEAPLGACSPLGMAAPSPKKEEVETPLYSLISDALICPLVGIFSLLLVGPPHEHPLRRSIAQSFIHHHHYVVVLLESPRIHCFRYPTGARDGGHRRSGRVTEYGGAARLWRSSSRP